MQLHRLRAAQWSPRAVSSLSVAGDRALAVRADGSLDVLCVQAASLLPLYRVPVRGSGRAAVVSCATEAGTAVVCADGTVELWDLSTGASRVVARCDAGPWAAAHSAGLFAVACDDATVRVFTCSSNSWELKARLLLPHASERPLCVALSKDGRCVASGTASGAVHIWDAATRRVLHSLGGGADAHPVWAAAAVSDALIVGDASGSVFLWDWETGTQIASVAVHEKADVLALAVIDDSTVAAAGADGSVRVLSRHGASWSAGLRTAPHVHDVRALAVCDAGGRRAILAGAADGSLVLSARLGLSGSRSERTVLACLEAAAFEYAHMCVCPSVSGFLAAWVEQEHACAVVAQYTRGDEPTGRVLAELRLPFISCAAALQSGDAVSAFVVSEGALSAFRVTAKSVARLDHDVRSATWASALCAHKEHLLLSTPSAVLRLDADARVVDAIAVSGIVRLDSSGGHAIGLTADGRVYAIADRAELCDSLAAAVGIQLADPIIGAWSLPSGGALVRDGNSLRAHVGDAVHAIDVSPATLLGVAVVGDAVVVAEAPTAALPAPAQRRRFGGF